MTRSHKWFVVLILSVLLLAPGAPSAPVVARAQFSPAYFKIECPGHIPVERGTVCGVLRVLENRAKPDGRVIDLLVFVLPALVDTPQPDPIVFLTGGPGSDASVWAYYTGAFARLRTDRDIIILEQRGTVHSNPALVCPAYGSAIAEAYMTDLPVVEAVQPAADALLNCRADLQAQGIDTNAYTTTENAADVEDLRVAMGIAQWNLFGASYGTNLALVVMRDHPAGLRSVILESVHAPSTQFFPETPHNFAAALDGAFAMCAADPRCASAYPDPEAAMYEVVDRLNEAPLLLPNPYGSEEIVLNGRAYLMVLSFMVYQTYYLDQLPYIIYETLRGEFNDLAAIAPGYLYSWNDIATVMHYTIQCTERLAYDTLADLETASAGLDPRFGDMADMDNFVTWAICLGMDNLYLNPADHEPVVSDVPALLISGQYDPVTPPDFAELALQTLSRGQHVIIPDAAHTPSFALPCVQLMLADFVAAPEAEVEMMCQ